MTPKVNPPSSQKQQAFDLVEEVKEKQTFDLVEVTGGGAFITVQEGLGIHDNWGRKE